MSNPKPYLPLKGWISRKRRRHWKRQNTFATSSPLSGKKNMNEPETLSAERGVDSSTALLADWSKISKEARETMAMLGDFGPTFNAKYREVKGYPQEQGKTYWSSDDLRKMAAHMNEVAEWLDTRAAKPASEKGQP